MAIHETFSNKIAIITGAASGIGFALSRELARRGALVVMVDRNADLLFASAASIKGEGFRVIAAQLDVTDHAAVKKLVDDIIAAHNRIDYLFNNAGVVICGEAQDFSLDDWHSVIDTNLYGVINGVTAVYPLMVKQGFGHIVNTSSVAGLAPFTGQVPYTASKHAIVGLSTALRIEGADLGVKVSVVCPGLIDTELMEKRPVKPDAATLAKALKPEDVAEAILACAKLPLLVCVPELTIVPTYI